MSDIAKLLSATRDNSKDVRAAAESQIDQYVGQYGSEFLTALIGVAANPESDVADSQSALLVLKNCVVKYWSPGFEQFVGPPLSHETRNSVRAGLLELLGVSPNHKIRSACALVIARIGSLEYPDQWPNLVEQTVAFLNNDADSPAVLGGLALFRELLLETFREEDFTVYGENVLQRLLEISSLPDKDGRRLTAIQCFRECVTFLLMGDDDQLPQLEEVGARFIPKWCELFCRFVKDDFQSPELVSEIVTSIREIDSAFPQILDPQLPSIFEVAEETLVSHLDELDDEIKSNLAYLLDIALQSKNAQRVCLGSGPKIDRFSLLLLRLSVMSEELADWWVDDFNEFVTAELELNTGEMHPRTNAASLVAMTGQPAILPRLLDMLHSVISETAAFPSASPQIEEACLFLISNLLAQVDINKHLVVVDFAKFKEFLASLQFTNSSASLSTSQSPRAQLLCARKIATAATVAKYGGAYLQDNVKYELATHAFSAPPSESAVVLVSQLKAISDCANLYPEAFLSHQSESLKLIAALIPKAEDDTPTFLAEVFGSVLKVDYEIVARDETVIDLLFSLAGKDTADIDLNAQILDIVGELLDTISTRPIVDRILKPIFSIIQSSAANGFEYSGDLYFTLDLATAVFEHQGVQFSTEEREEMLQSFYQVIITTQDPQILQAASFTYAALVQNIEGAVSAEVANNVLKVAAQLLNPELADSAALASGNLVKAIIDHFGSELGGMLDELIDACARRLAKAENALLIETLVLVFCELTLRNPRAVLDILSRTDMLEPVMKQWLPTFEVVRGADEINKNIRALESLFELNDPRLNTMMLPGEPIRKSNAILTRRMAKNVEFTQVPATLKILKLLIRELLQAPSPQNKGTPLKLNDSDDEWDDELALDDEGDVVDLRTYHLILDWIRLNLDKSVMIEWFPKLSENERDAVANLLK